MCIIIWPLCIDTFKKEEYDIALVNYTKVLDIDLVHHGPTSTHVANTFGLMGNVYQDQRKYDKAIWSLIPRP